MKREDYIPDEMVVKRANAAVKIELEKKKAMDISIITYDSEKQIIYTECRFADLGENPIYPNSLYLAHNQISDASVITSMYGNWGENTIYYLDL